MSLFEIFTSKSILFKNSDKFLTVRISGFFDSIINLSISPLWIWFFVKVSKLFVWFLIITFSNLQFKLSLELKVIFVFWASAKLMQQNEREI